LRRARREQPRRQPVTALRDHHLADLARLDQDRRGKAAQHAAPVFMYQLAYKNPTLVPGTDFPLGSPHASDINLKFANAECEIVNDPDKDERLFWKNHA
jgi:carboxylesterase type B